MVLKILTHPTTGKTFKMGRRRPIACGMRPRLRNYINIGALPTPPAVVDYYCVVSKDALNKKTQKTSAGFDWDQLSADFDSMGGNV